MNMYGEPMFVLIRHYRWSRCALLFKRGDKTYQGAAAKWAGDWAKRQINVHMLQSVSLSQGKEHDEVAGIVHSLKLQEV